MSEKLLREIATRVKVVHTPSQALNFVQWVRLETEALDTADQPSVCPHGYPKHADPHWVNACCVADPTTQPSDARCPVIDAPHVFEGGKCRHCRIADPTAERKEFASRSEQRRFEHQKKP